MRKWTGRNKVRKKVDVEWEKKGNQISEWFCVRQCGWGNGAAGKIWARNIEKIKPKPKPKLSQMLLNFLVDRESTQTANAISAIYSDSTGAHSLFSQIPSTFMARYLRLRSFLWNESDRIVLPNVSKPCLSEFIPNSENCGFWIEIFSTMFWWPAISRGQWHSAGQLSVGAQISNFFIPKYHPYGNLRMKKRDETNGEKIRFDCLSRNFVFIAMTNGISRNFFRRSSTLTKNPHNSCRQSSQFYSDSALKPSAANHNFGNSHPEIRANLADEENK
jgi:hypothetical protein